MDSARTAHRLVGNNGKVTVVYRRTVDEMPADEGEIKAVIEEGIQIVELTAPEKIVSANGKVKALLCSRMELKGVDAKGRPNPVKVANSEYEIECDVIIPAVGQALDIDFVPNELLKADTRTYKTLLGNRGKMLRPLSYMQGLPGLQKDSKLRGCPEARIFLVLQ